MISMTLVGDIMLGGIFSEKHDMYIDSFIPDEYLKYFNSDVVFANLECACSNAGKPVDNKILVYSKKESFAVLEKLNINVVNLANNHILDYGLEAAYETMEELDKLGIAYSGVGRNIAEASKPALLEKDNGLIAFLCFSWTDEWLEKVTGATEDAIGVNPFEINHVLNSIKKTNELYNPKLLVVSLHWGEGKSHYVRPDSVLQARQMVNAGADLIVGHHTHCLQGYEIYKGKPIFYNLGNFLCSTYRKLPNKRLTYGGNGKLRTRNLRERKTVIANVNYCDESQATIKIIPILQNRKEPVLQNPGEDLSKKIPAAIERLSKQLSKAKYKCFYPIYRRVDEIKRIYEDYSEEGFKDLSWKTPYYVIKKLFLGKSLG